ncbi:unnamed protein product, partial [marine sediment metagenome]
MPNKTLIEWVKNPDGTQGYTLNPITGCLNHTPEGLCLGGMFPCYAWRLANGRLKYIYRGNTNIAPVLPSIPEKIGKARFDPFYPRFWEDRIDEARLELVNAKPRGIFVCDMGELFGGWIPKAWQEEVMDMVK